jgi:hypothetical protein
VRVTPSARDRDGRINNDENMRQGLKGRLDANPPLGWLNARSCRLAWGARYSEGAEDTIIRVGYSSVVPIDPRLVGIRTFTERLLGAHLTPDLLPQLSNLQARYAANLFSRQSANGFAGYMAW